MTFRGENAYLEDVCCVGIAHDASYGRSELVAGGCHVLLLERVGGLQKRQYRALPRLLGGWPEWHHTLCYLEPGPAGELAFWCVFQFLCTGGEEEYYVLEHHTFCRA